MNAIALIAICCITVVISAPNNFDLYYNITFNYDPQMYEYSPDQQFLAITAKNSVLIYDAKSAKLIQAISTNTSGTTTAVSFSRDSGYLAFGNIESIVQIYYLQKVPYPFKKFALFNFSDATLGSSVSSLCFAADNKFLIVGFHKGLLSAWNLSQSNPKAQQLSPIDDLTSVEVVVCSPTLWNVFAAGLQIESSMPPINTFAFYNISNLNNYTSLLNTSFPIVSATYNGNYIYTIDNNGYVYTCDTLKNSCTKINQNQTVGQYLNKICVSTITSNLIYIAVSQSNSLSQTQRITLFINPTFSSNDDDPQVLTFNSTVPSVALSTTGGILFLISTVRHGASYSACPTKQFLDTNGNCQICKSGCKYCFSTNNTCYGCNSDNFDVNNGTCVCKKKFYQDGDDCSPCMQYCEQCTATACQSCTWLDLDPLDLCQTCIDKMAYFDPNSNHCYSCNITLDFCVKCSNSDECLDCKNGTNRSPQSGICKCNAGYWQNINKICQLCSDSILGCIACQNASVCQKCDTDNHWIFNGTNQCICADKYYQSGKNCLDCSEKCKTCTNDTACQSCFSDDLDSQDLCKSCIDKMAYYDPPSNHCISCNFTLHFCIKCLNSSICLDCQSGTNTQIINGQCQCIKGYWEDENRVCQKCSDTIVGCIDCLNVDACEECDTKNHWALNGTSKCVCAQRFYQSGNTCLDCLDKCQICINDTGCQSCISPDLDLSDLCQSCIDKQSYFNETQNQCFSCYYALDFCVKCVSSTVCTECQNGTNSQLVNGSCKCIKGFWQDENKKCLECQDTIPGCINCKNGDLCYQCDDINHWIINTTTRKCDCKNRYYQSGNICLNCSEKCITCKNDTACQSCFFDDLDPSDLCKSCIDKQAYFNETQRHCQSCNATLDFCVKCSNSTVCDDCQNGTNTELINGQCKCIKGYWQDANKTCKYCSDTIVGCIDCLNGDVCKECDSNSHWALNKTSKCVCDAHYFNLSNECKQCVAGCNICSNNVTCDTCNISGNWIPDKHQQCRCQNEYFNQTNYQCKSCILGCLVCNQSEECLVCDPTRNFENQPDKKCDCKYEFFLDEEKCKPCVANCLACQKTQQCDECSPRFFKNTKQLCQPCMDNCLKCHDKAGCFQCDPSFFFINQKCQPCVESCSICNQTSKCINCTERFFKNDSQLCQQCMSNCLKCDNKAVCTQCDPSFFFDGENCSSCVGNCSICNEASKCINCTKRFFKDNSQLCQPCMNNCLNCRSSVTCDDCDQSFFFNGQLCQSCLPGCLQCQKNDICQKCDFSNHFQLDSQGDCICIDGYYFDKKSSNCLKCSMAGCDICSSQQQCQKCSSKLHFKQLPVNGICECNQSQHYELDANKTVCKCMSHYFNTQKDHCQKCISHCVACLNEYSCRKCQQTFTNKYGICQCKSNQFLQNQTKCINCSQNCIKCQSGNLCIQCDYMYYIDHGQCAKSGMIVLAIVLIVAGVAGLEVAVFFIIRAMKKKRVRLSQNEYQEL